MRPAAVIVQNPVGRGAEADAVLGVAGGGRSAPQWRQLLDAEARRYVEGLRRLRPRDRRLIVGRAELGYSYRQLASMERLPSPDAARMALRRALVQLSGAISHP